MTPSPTPPKKCPKCGMDMLGDRTLACYTPVSLVTEGARAFDDGEWEGSLSKPKSESNDSVSGRTRKARNIVSQSLNSTKGLSTVGRADLFWGRWGRVRK
jgi:hypothetical protein